MPLPSLGCSHHIVPIYTRVHKLTAVLSNAGCPCIKVGARDRDILWCGLSILVSVFDVIVEYCLTLGVRVLRLVQMRGLRGDCRPLTLTKLCRG